MGDKSGIEWTDATWNPVTGCTKISPGCANCYITRTMPFRTQGRRFERVGNEMRTDVQLHPDRLDRPLRWKRPRRIFVNSLSDLFHEDVPDLFIARVFARMEEASWHTFQVLTKRPERALAWFNTPIGETFSGRRVHDGTWPLPNVWLGVSVENQRWTSRLDILREIPAAVRFVSCEPLLGPIDLRPWLAPVPDAVVTHGHLTDETARAIGEVARAAVRKLFGLDWVIVGGESGGPLRRRLFAPPRFDGRWVRSLRDQCVEAGVPFMFKQWGGATPKSGGRLLDGREWSEYPEEVRVA